MKHIYDRRYPVTSILLLVTTAVFLSMFIRFGGGYQTGAAVFYSGGVVGDIIKADPSQLWRLLTAVFVHIGLEHFVLNMITLITWAVWQRISSDRKLSWRSISYQV